MMKRINAIRFDTYDEAWEKASKLKKGKGGKEGKDWKVKIVRHGSVRNPDDEFFEVISYVDVPDKDKKNGVEAKDDSN